MYLIANVLYLFKLQKILSFFSLIFIFPIKQFIDKTNQHFNIEQEKKKIFFHLLLVINIFNQSFYFVFYNTKTFKKQEKFCLK